MVAGELKVVVVSAKDLPNKDERGKSDPYVNVWLEKGYVQKTQTIVGNLNPVWNEEFTFQVGEGTHAIHFDVFDSDEPSKEDDALGSVKVDLKDVFSKGVVEKTEPLSTSWFGLSKQDTR
ncbi:calcineurin temperature suppressor cts1 [Gigaspora margarita]|uniref:Calcineurin temperature suppressor cts1 n=1 Tax=Gigaspora margarita TaxID=4874 RepID=A0A8H4AVK0_GIGMA|nr:calcineurin temperature suppressor cts1 [Gigaspora margarita]